MLNWLTHLQLTAPIVVCVSAALLAATTIATFILRRGRRRYDVVAATVSGIVGAVLGLLTCYIVQDRMNLLGLDLTVLTRVWVAIAFAGLFVGITALIRARAWPRRVAAVSTVVLALLAPALGVNADYAVYPTIATALQPNPYTTYRPTAQHAAGAAASLASTQTWQAPADMPSAGAVHTVHIPGTRSHWTARPAVIYLPPAAQVTNPPVLPVVIAFSGQPGAPADLFRLGNLHHRLDAIARAHHGIAPIVVSVDQLGAPERNPMCLDSPLGNVTTYVTTDVTDWITSNLNVSRDRSNWGLLGFSQGATCTMQYLSGHSDRFSRALAISSQITPITGNANRSAAAAFHGSVDAWKAAAPAAVMTRHGVYRDTSVIFVTGATDATSTTNATQLGAAARTVGISTHALTSPGSGHDWKTVRFAFDRALPTLAEQLAAR